MDDNIWQQILTRLRAELPAEDFRRWFDTTTYASDSGDQITIWVSTEGIRRHILLEYNGLIRRALRSMDRPDTQVRFVVAGVTEEEDDGRDD